MFTKDKKRAGEKKPDPQRKNPRPAGTYAEAPAREGMPPHRRPAGTPAREGVQPHRRPAGTSAREDAQPRRRPAAPAEEERTRRIPVTRQTDTGRYPETPVSPVQHPQEGQAEDQVFQIEQPPRQTPVTRRTAPKTPEKQKAKPVRKKKSGPPQGTSYHRSTPKQRKSIMDVIREKTANPYADPEDQAAAARARKAARAEQKQKLQKLAAKFDAPAIVYTQPRPFNRNRLLIQMISVLAVASAFVMALSIFFKVENITVSGADTYSPYKIQEASGIHKGDYLLTFGRARACGQITAKLPYIESVRIGIKLPNTVNIDVQEAAVAYSIRSDDGDWWLITSEGKVVKQIPGTTSGGYTTVLGVQIENPIPGELATALEAVPDSTEPSEGEKQDGEKKEENSLLEPPVTVSATMRLKSALRILVALEENDIVGDAATVNVENLEKIELWYGQKYQVNLGNTEQLEYKVACMYDAILQMSEYQNGMLDVSFTKKKDQVVYTPFV